MRSHTLTLRLIFTAAASLMIITSDGLARSPTDLSTRENLTVRKAVYSISEDKSHDLSYCLYRNGTKLFCHEYGFISFEQRVKTRDYDLIVTSLPEQGSGIRWWDWKLIVEDGKQAAVKPLADGCLECDIRVEKFEPYSNNVNFVYRQDKHRVSARFRAGQLSIRKSKLDPREPLDKETCDGLYQYLQLCKSNSICSMRGGTAGNFFIGRTEDRYAGFSGEPLDTQCKEACSTGTVMDRSTFFKQVCRRAAH